MQYYETIKRVCYENSRTWNLGSEKVSESINFHSPESASDGRDR